MKMQTITCRFGFVIGKKQGNHTIIMRSLFSESSVSKMFSIRTEKNQAF